jgi:hypothetical protein
MGPTRMKAEAFGTRRGWRTDGARPPGPKKTGPVESGARHFRSSPRENLILLSDSARPCHPHRIRRIRRPT